jgi:hypothetical protein
VHLARSGMAHDVVERFLDDAKQADGMVVVEASAAAVIDTW